MRLLLFLEVEKQEIVRPDKDTSAHDFFLDRKIVVPSIVGFLQNFVWGGLIAFLPLYAIKCGIANPGYFFSANAVMLIAGRALGGRDLDTYSKENIIRTLIFTSMVAMVILAFSRTLPMFIAVGILWGTGGGFFFPTSMAYALDYAGSSGWYCCRDVPGALGFGIGHRANDYRHYRPPNWLSGNVPLSGPYLSHQS